MEKKKIVVSIIYLIIFVWIFLVGQAGQSILSGNFNLIDEGQFATWISYMNAGKMLYRDFYVQYGPLMILPVFSLSKIFGIVLAIKIWQATTTCMGIVVASLLLREFKVNKFIFYTAIVSLVFLPGINFRHWIGGLIIYLLLKTMRSHSPYTAVLTGFLLTIAIFQSIEVGIFTIVICLLYAIVVLITSKSIYIPLKLLSSVLISTIITALLFGFIFQYQGWFWSYISTTIEFSSSIAGNALPNGQGLPNLFGYKTNLSDPFDVFKFFLSKEALFYWSLLFLLISISMGVIRISIGKKGNGDLLLPLLSLYVVFIYFSIIGRSGHYFTIVPFVVVIGAFWISELRRHSVKSKNISWLFGFVYLVYILYGVRHLLILKYVTFSNFYTPRAIREIDLISPFAVTFSEGEEIFGLQSFFKVNSNAYDKIYVLNNLPGLYFLLKKENASRYDIPLLAGSIEKRFAVINSLDKNKPKYIIEDKSAWAIDGVSDRSRMPEIFEYVRKNYSPYSRVGRYMIYLRK